MFMIDQNLLPFSFSIYEAKTYHDSCLAIKTMKVRGAGAIGAAAGFAMAQAFLEAPKDSWDSYINMAYKNIARTRPTSHNLFYALNRVFFSGAQHMLFGTPSDVVREAQLIAEEDVESCKKIGEYGNSLIKNGARIETHCNAGWLAFVEYGTALSPVYVARQSGKKVFIYIDETRPRGQGARLTAWELQNENIPHSIIPDNAGASLMSQGIIDIMIVGADTIAANGDVANKIGTLEKAICAHSFKIPFYVAAPTSTFDLTCATGKHIPIENRSEDEVLYQTGLTKQGSLETVLVCSPNSRAFNPAFDITPAKYITGIITEKGIIPPSRRKIRRLFS